MNIEGNKVNKMKDFENLSSQMQKVDPTGTQSSKFEPTHTPRDCPPVSDDWLSSNKLPPTPNDELCGCMQESLSCVVSDSVEPKQFAELFGTVCGYGESVCAGINTNATTGEYGAYSMCHAKQKLSFAMNRYYQQQKEAGNGANACDFDGAATKVSASQPSGDCKKLLKQAGKNGQGNVSGGGSSGGGSGGGDSSSSSSGAASPMAAPRAVNAGVGQIVLYVGSAMVAALGMIWL